MRMRTSKKIAT